MTGQDGYHLFLVRISVPHTGPESKPNAALHEIYDSLKIIFVRNNFNIRICVLHGVKSWTYLSNVIFVLIVPKSSLSVQPSQVTWYSFWDPGITPTIQSRPDCLIKLLKKKNLIMQKRNKKKLIRIDYLKFSALRIRITHHLFMLMKHP